MSPARALLATRLVHTAIWAVMAGAIIALPALALTDQFGWALAIAVLMAGEGVALGLSGGACPLTAIARRYTDDPSPAFDIFLPVWLAKWNKVVFGALFVFGEALVLVRVHFAPVHVGVVTSGVALTAAAFALGAHLKRTQPVTG
ncbi:MAG: hypothetical protein U0228_10140 [Myxococcaceae bacterium]